MGNNMELIAKKAVWARPGAGGRGGRHQPNHADYAVRVSPRHTSYGGRKYAHYAIRFNETITELCFTEGSRIKVGILEDNLILLPTKDTNDSYAVCFAKGGKSEIIFSAKIFPQAEEFVGEYKKLNKASDCGDETLYFLAKGDKFDD